MFKIKQPPLEINDLVSIGTEDGRPILATLRDIFADQVLVAVRNKPNELVQVHRDTIARVHIPNSGISPTRH